jgi:hypothetical protein
VQKFIVVLLAGLCFLITACGAEQPSNEIPTDLRELLGEVVENMQATDTFQLTLEQIGPPYPLLLSLDGVSVIEAELQRGTAQFINPNELFINAKLRIGFSVSVDIFSRDERQWVSFPSGGSWHQLPPFPDFDISRLMAENDGMDYAMKNLNDIEFIGEETLIDGTTALHLQANATGDVVYSLLFGLVVLDENVQVDVYITPDDKRLALVELTMLESNLGDNDEKSVWRLEFYGYNEPQYFDSPPAKDEAEATEEA